jgi:hypothetical protein
MFSSSDQVLVARWQRYASQKRATRLACLKLGADSVSEIFQKLRGVYRDSSFCHDWDFEEFKESMPFPMY